jgi:glycogen debranching enzyme
MVEQRAARREAATAAPLPGTESPGGEAPGHSGFGAESPERAGQVLVEGTTFVVSGPGGDIDGPGQGLFVRDARVVSRWCLRIDGKPVGALGGFRSEPFAGVFVGRGQVRDGHLEPTLLVERRRYVGTGMREDLVLRNFGGEAAGVTVALEVGADFADLFAVKLGEAGEGSRVEVTAAGEEWTATGRQGSHDRAVHVRALGATATADGLVWRAVVPPHGQWPTSIAAATELDGELLPMRFPLDTPVEHAAPVRSIAEWQRATARVRSDSLALDLTIKRSEDDLASLRLADPTEPDLTVIAAGAPWFMALFGRDSLITSALTMALNTEIATGSLRALARHQGKTLDPLSEEEPGKILHELRFGVDVSFALGGAERYFGSVDATPLFVLVLGQLARWGADPEVVDSLLPAADAALAWIDAYGDQDGDGYVEYRRSTDRGLRNQGWKDSADGVNFADGTLAEPPIALVEVQGYVYGAFCARAELAARRGDEEAASHWAERARDLKARFNEDFWLPDRGYFAVGLDADKRPIDALASNMGHALWAGIVDAEKAAVVAGHLCSPELFSGYGIRTLATSMGAYNPASYHNGSVWPHDTAICVAGLVRYGFTELATKVATGLLEAASYFSGRLPELFCGFGRSEVPGPVPYPASCSPQAWASAAPVGVLTALLGLEPDVPGGVVRLAPALPPEWGSLTIEDIPLGRERLSVAVGADGTLRCSAPAGLRLDLPPA